MAGEVPKKYYASHLSIDRSNFTAATVGRASSLQLDFHIDEPGKLLRYFLSFRTMQHGAKGLDSNAILTSSKRRRITVLLEFSQDARKNLRQKGGSY